MKLPTRIGLAILSVMLLLRDIHLTHELCTDVEEVNISLYPIIYLINLFIIYRCLCFSFKKSLIIDSFVFAIIYLVVISHLWVYFVRVILPNLNLLILTTFG